MEISRWCPTTGNLHTNTYPALEGLAPNPVCGIQQGSLESAFKSRVNQSSVACWLSPFELKCL